MKDIAILGSTGSIGTTALEVVDKAPDHFRIIGLAAGRNINLLAKQIEHFRPQIVSVMNANDIAPLREALVAKHIYDVEILSGQNGINAIASHNDVSLLLTAMVGIAGLEPTLVAIRRGITVAIANKESLVVAGQLCTNQARIHNATLLPVDSEHSAIHQCLTGHKIEDIHRIMLTCSGGPFLNTKDLSSVTIEQALAHPTWSMGQKISVDSATLMNKGLEVIEAHWLFNLCPKQIEVLIHPQSIVHSMVEFQDGSVLAQMGTPDMHIPITYALAYPNRLSLGWPKVDWKKMESLSFSEPDKKKFPCLSLAYEALEGGGTYPTVLNAANETAVSFFLQQRIGYLDIPMLIQKTLETHTPSPANSLEQILAADNWAREQTMSTLNRISGK